MGFRRDPLLDKTHLQNLTKYKYSAVDKSLLTKYVLRHYWDAALYAFPKSMAPNLITLTGLVFILINVLTLMIYIFDLSTPASPWVYYSFAIGLFLYQTFDNVDGRQARRTRASSALGHIFDHTIDSLNTPFSALIQAGCMCLGQSNKSLLVLTIGFCAMWFSTWEEYFTGTLYLGYFNGPDEGILIACCVQLISGYFGPTIWHAYIKLPFIFREVKVVDLFLSFVASGLIFLHLPTWLVIINWFDLILQFAYSLYNVYVACQHKPYSFTKAVIQNFTFLAFNILFLSWIWSPYSLIQTSGNLSFFILFLAFSFGKLNSRVILARLTIAPFPKFEWDVLAPVLGGAVMINLSHFGFQLYLYELLYLKFCLAYACFNFVSWFTMLCGAFCEELNISCFRIPPKKGI